MRTKIKNLWLSLVIEIKKLGQLVSGYYRKSSLFIKTLICLAVLLMSAATYLFFALIMIRPGEIALVNWRRSFSEEIICHETCAAQRRSFKEAVLKDLKKSSRGSVARLIENYFSDAELDLDFKIELIKILSLAYGTSYPPEYLREYSLSSSDEKLVGALITAFSPQALGGGEASDLDYYFTRLAAPGGLEFKREIITLISTYEFKERDFSREQLAIIKRLIFTASFDSALRADLVFLLGDYYAIFPEETVVILEGIYQSSGDNLSRLLATDLLNTKVGLELNLPEVSAEEWAQYYGS